MTNEDPTIIVTTELKPYKKLQVKSADGVTLAIYAYSQALMGATTLSTVKGRTEAEKMARFLIGASGQQFLKALITHLGGKPNA